MNKIIVSSKYFLKQLLTIQDGLLWEDIEMVADAHDHTISFGYLGNTECYVDSSFSVKLYKKTIDNLIKHLLLIDEQPITLKFDDSELFNVKIYEMIV